MKQKIATKNYLLQQVQNKKERQKEEIKRNHVQAEIWQKEAEEYEKTENEKQKYIREMNKEHEKVLKSMFKQSQNLTKMDGNELLMNKHQLKKISKKKGLEKKSIKLDYKKLYQG